MDGELHSIRVLCRRGSCREGSQSHRLVLGDNPESFGQKISIVFIDQKDSKSSLNHSQRKPLHVLLGCVPSNSENGAMIAVGATFDEQYFTYTCTQRDEDTVTYQIKSALLTISVQMSIYLMREIAHMILRFSQSFMLRLSRRCGQCASCG